MLVRLLAVLLVLAFACSQATPAGKPDFRTCRGFLDTAKVSQVAGLTNLEEEVRSLTKSAKAQQPSIQAYCEVTFYLPGRVQAITLAVIRYASTNVAQTQYQRVRDGLRLGSAGERFTDGIIGQDSYGVEVNAQGLGSFVGFLQGTDVVSLQTAMPTGGPAPATMDQLRRLAQVVRAKLP